MEAALRRRLEESYGPFPRAKDFAHLRSSAHVQESPTERNSKRAQVRAYRRRKLKIKEKKP